MGLTSEDLLQIRQLFNEAFDEKTKPLVGEIAALRNNIAEIYDMIARLDRRMARLEKRAVIVDDTFLKLPEKEQILQLHAAILALAKKKGITLPN